MNCIYCEAELTLEDSWGNKEYIIYGTVSKSGDIYICPNHEGFETEKEALEYIDNMGESLESLEIDSWEDIVCDSSCHVVSGSFYTDRNNRLYEGYPC